VKLPKPPASAKASTKQSAASATRASHQLAPSRRRSRAVSRALEREGLTPSAITFDHRGCVARDEMLVRGARTRFSLKGTLHETAGASQA
jgi:hypothetical protein